MFIMADVVDETMFQLQKNLRENANNDVSKSPTTPVGMAIAYGSLVIMALLPVYFGSFRSARHSEEEKESSEKPMRISYKKAAMFPLIASVTLFGFYSLSQTSSNEFKNLLMMEFLFVLSVQNLCHLLRPVTSSLVRIAIPDIPFHLHFTRGRSEASKDIVNYQFSSHDVVCLIFCSIIAAWYLVHKHWVANNLLAIVFAINFVEMLRLNNVATGCILLCGLFIYDIFWVLGTNLMVTVAISIEGPIKLVFPGDFLEQGLAANNFAMLGLGDIVVPGIFIALLLRFDNSLKRSSTTYFNATFVAYFLGLMVAIFVTHLFKHAQPALLYLVPACLGTPLCLALVKGDSKAMFQYEDHPSEKQPECAEDKNQ